MSFRLLFDFHFFLFSWVPRVRSIVFAFRSNVNIHHSQAHDLILLQSPNAPNPYEIINIFSYFRKNREKTAINYIVAVRRRAIDTLLRCVCSAHFIYFLFNFELNESERIQRINNIAVEAATAAKYCEKKKKRELNG